MSYKKSTFDQLSDKIAPAIRQLKDIHVSVVGTRANVIRVVQTSVDLMGDITTVYSGQVIHNVIIRYPFSNIELFASKDTGSLDNTAIDLFELLPITMVVPFDTYISGTAQSDEYVQNPTDIDENDLIVNVLYDAKNNAIPLVHKVSRIYGGFFGRNQTNKRYELTLVRGEESPDIQNIINAFISGEAINKY